MMQVERSSQSIQSDSFSAPITRTCRTVPARTRSAATREPVAEARARGVEVEGGRCRDPDPVRDLGGGVRDVVEHRAGGDDDRADLRRARAPASFSARAPASAAMSTSCVSLSAIRRLSMPTRERIHSSLVSTRAASSSLVTTRSGWKLPSPSSRAPGTRLGEPQPGASSRAPGRSAQRGPRTPAPWRRPGRPVS